jgi:hypothetical protein
MTLVACAPKQISVEPTSDIGDEQVLEAPVWSPETNCESCHTTEAQSVSDTTFLYSQSQHSSLSCSSCHTNDSNLLTKAHENYANKSTPVKLRRSEVGNTICLSCHNAEELKAATASLTLLTDSEGTTVNPHSLPETESHTTIVHCSSCHKMHSNVAANVTAKETCTGCHHQNVFQCGTCH